MSIAIVTLAEAIQWPVALAMIRVSAATVAVAERCQLWPRTGLAPLDIGEWCSRVARRMLLGGRRGKRIRTSVARRPHLVRQLLGMKTDLKQIHSDAERAAGKAKLTFAMVLVMLLLLGLSLAFAPSEWGAECVMGSIIVPGVIFWIVEKYGGRFG